MYFHLEALMLYFHFDTNAISRPLWESRKYAITFKVAVLFIHETEGMHKQKHRETIVHRQHSNWNATDSCVISSLTVLCG